MILRRGRTFLRLGWRKQLIFFEALALVAFAFAATTLLPFVRIRRLYGRPRSGNTADETASAPSDAAALEIGEVRWALRMIHERLGWDRSCLLRAMAGRIMLRRRGHACTMYIGACREHAGNMRFHAWLRAYGVPVSGVREARSFTTLAIFDSEP